MSIDELIEKGEEFLNKEKYEKAEKIFNNAIEEYPDSPNIKKAWYGLGTAVYKLSQKRSGQEKLDQEKEAISYYNKALILDPNYIGPLKGIAWVYREMDKPDNNKAIECYDKILKICYDRIKIKTSPVTLTVLTKTLIKKAQVLYITQKKYAEALECCDKALELVPDYNKAKELKAFLKSRIMSDTIKK